MSAKPMGLDQLPVRVGRRRTHPLAGRNHDKGDARKTHADESDKEKRSLKPKAIHHWSDRISEREAFPR